MNKVAFPVDKHKWCPSLIPGPVMLISTCTAQGKPNVAPKSWVQMAAFEPPTLMLAGTKGNATENNILQTGCFGVNVVDEALAPHVFACLQWFGTERIEKSGFHLMQANLIAAPLVVEARAHLECRLRATREIGSGFALFGEIVAASIDDEILAAPPEERYAQLGQVLFLEDGLVARLGQPTHATFDPGATVSVNGC
jgi:flavin reductase (DIM6/NTAB) family NADH-FMN oxidoreductase RutF